METKEKIQNQIDGQKKKIKERLGLLPPIIKKQESEIDRKNPIRLKNKSTHSSDFLNEAENLDKSKVENSFNKSSKQFKEINVIGEKNNKNLFLNENVNLREPKNSIDCPSRFSLMNQKADLLEADFQEPENNQNSENVIRFKNNQLMIPKTVSLKGDHSGE